LLHEVIGEYGAEAVVMYLISGHYRQPLAFSDSALAQAQANVKRISEAGRRLGAGTTTTRDSADIARLESLRDGFFDALANDFNTPLALAQLNEWLTAAGSLGASGDTQLREMLAVLGLGSLLAPMAEAPETVRALAKQREQARAERDFATSDRLRAEIAAHGWDVRDGAGGFELLPQ
jgi:cysteinyl-tRNA synthetase